jgi:hypothetical protein
MCRAPTSAVSEILRDAITPAGWVAGEIDGITAIVLVLFGAFVAALVKLRRA